MLAAFLAFVAELFGKWINKAPAVAPVAQELGKTQEALTNAQAGEKAVSEAHSASDAVLRGAVADPGVLRQPSPDSRD
jgi:hypothetical protein